MFNLKRSIVPLIGVLVLCAVEARADSFVISDVGGSVFVATSFDFGPPTLKLPPILALSGPGLSITTRFPPASGADVGNVEARDTCIISGCAPGTVLGTNSTFSGIMGACQSTTASVNGVHYQFVNVTGSMNFVSSAIVLPNFGNGIGQLTIPFSFSGQLTGDAFQPDVVNPIFTATLSGRGLATFTFFETSRDLANPRYRLSSIEYQFEVPEPTTLLLLSSALSGLIAATRRRRKFTK
jgi:hypothetical protein